MIVYIASPYKANSKEQLEKHITYAKELARGQVLIGDDVIVPHLYYTLFMDDNNKDERALGKTSALNLVKLCQVLVVGRRYGISEGMQDEIDRAIMLDKVIKYID